MSQKTTKASTAPLQNKVRLHVIIDDNLVTAGREYVSRHKPVYRGIGHLLECLLTTRLIEAGIMADPDKPAGAAKSCRRKKN